jgi:Fur family ferric uptake transcriptional regulator
MTSVVDTHNKDALKSVGFRATKPRLLLISYLNKNHSPLLISEIVSGLRSKRVDQVTVYRMIEAFTKAGILREVNLSGDRPRYELADLEHDHHHIVCTNCRKVEDFVGCDTERLEKKALQQSHFSKITGHAFDLYGLCESCAK